MTNTENRPGNWHYLSNCLGSSSRDRANSRAYTRWCLALAVSLLLSTAALKFEWVGSPMSWVVAAIPPLVLMMAIRAYLHFLVEADEFVRKVNLEGMSIGFGASVIYFFLLDALEKVALIGPQADDMLAVALIGWALGQLYVAWKYR